MASYYKHTQKQSVNVPYSFRCEQCHQDSGPLEAVITGEGEVDNYRKDLLDSEKAKLEKRAHSALVQALQKAHRDAEEKQIYSSDFRDECPHCHQPQSWAIAQMKSDQFTGPTTALIVALICSLGTYFFSDTQSIHLSLGIFAVGVVVAGVLLARNRMKIGAKQKVASTAMEHERPTIHWEVVQDLLDEKV